MNSPLFNIFNPGPQVQTGNPLLNFLGNMPNGQNALATAQRLMQQTNQSPEQIVKSMLQSGQKLILRECPEMDISSSFLFRGGAHYGLLHGNIFR